MSDEKQKLIREIHKQLAELDRLERPDAGARLLDNLKRQAKGGSHE